MPSLYRPIPQVRFASALVEEHSTVGRGAGAAAEIGAFLAHARESLDRYSRPGASAGGLRDAVQATSRAHSRNFGRIVARLVSNPEVQASEAHLTPQMHLLEEPVLSGLGVQMAQVELAWALHGGDAREGDRRAKEAEAAVERAATAAAAAAATAAATAATAAGGGMGAGGGSGGGSGGSRDCRPAEAELGALLLRARVDAVRGGCPLSCRTRHQRTVPPLLLSAASSQGVADW